MERTRLARIAAVPAAALLVTTAGAALATDDPAKTAGVEDQQAEKAGDAALTEQTVAAAVQAYLESEEGQALLEEVADADTADLEARIAELEEKVAAQAERIATAEGDAAAAVAALEELKAQLAAVSQQVAGKDVPPPTWSSAHEADDRAAHKQDDWQARFADEHEDHDDDDEWEKASRRGDDGDRDQDDHDHDGKRGDRHD